MADNYGDQVTAIGGIEFYGIGKDLLYVCVFVCAHVCILGYML